MAKCRLDDFASRVGISHFNISNLARYSQRERDIMPKQINCAEIVERNDNLSGRNSPPLNPPPTVFHYVAICTRINRQNVRPAFLPILFYLFIKNNDLLDLRRLPIVVVVAHHKVSDSYN